MLTGVGLSMVTWVLLHLHSLDIDTDALQELSAAFALSEILYPIFLHNKETKTAAAGITDLMICCPPLLRSNNQSVIHIQCIP